MTEKIQRINEVQFNFLQLPSKKALKLATQVAKEVGPMLGKIGKLDLSKFKSEEALNGEIPADLLEVLGGILAELDEDKLDYFCNEFAEFTSYVDKDGNTKPLKNVAYFEQCFQGDAVFIMKWMIGFVKTNFLGSIFGLKK